MIKLNAKELRTYEREMKEKKNQGDQIIRNQVYIILDNVLDTYNIGSIFRLADAVAAEEVIITGQAEVPPNTRIKKASINTTEWVKWQYTSTAKEAIEELRIIAVEQNEKSIPYVQMKCDFPIAIVVGNEANGISKEVLEICDQIIELPMWGVNKSLNVMASLAIVLYKIMEK